jgi:hypothetical protein
LSPGHLGLWGILRSTRRKNIPHFFITIEYYTINETCIDDTILVYVLLAWQEKIMQNIFENRIDSEKIINSWIENATHIWETIVTKNKEEDDSSGIEKDATNSAFKAWEPAMKTWKEFAETVNKKIGRAHV